MRKKKPTAKYQLQKISNDDYEKKLIKDQNSISEIVVKYY